VSWDALNAPPRHDGSWDVCVVSVTSWDVVRRVYAWLTQTEHDFSSVVLDSITELQRRLKQNISSDGMIKGYDGWGQLLVQMDNLIRSMRDLTIQPGPVRCVMFVAETVEKSGKWRPAMQGQIASSLPYWVDICAYAYQTRLPDDDGNLTRKAVNLFIGQHDSFESGERVAGLLPDNIVNPSISDMMATIYPEESVK
jgi:hypothetical protein